MSPQFTLRLSTTPPRFPNQIREYRIRAGLTQRKLAQLIGRARGVVSAWECGHALPSVPSLLTLAKSLGTLAESLYVGLIDRGPKDQPPTDPNGA